MQFDRLTDGPERTAAAAKMRADRVRVSRYIKIGILAALVIFPTVYLTLFGQRSLASMKAAIKDRAMIEYADDFRSGFLHWGPAAAENWAVDPAGSVRPNGLALFRPSMAMTDYQFEFLGQIEKGGIEFVTRAVDEQNYWAGRISIASGTPNPKATISHWAVVGGKASAPRELPVPMSFRPDALLRVWVSAYGEKVQVAINGQLSDYWDDTYFKKGGVGFFASKGTSFRVISVRVWDKDDFLGQICYRLSANSADSKVPAVR